MMHANELDLGPLTWVKSEIDQALARSAEALSVARGSPEDLSHIQFAQTHLHQACGALSIVGLDGLTRFATSLDQLLGNMARGGCTIDEGSLGVAARGLASITNYLEELVRGTPDQPLRLFPLYSRITELQGGAPAKPTELFYPDLTRRPPRGAAAPADAAQQLRRVRPLFPKGLLQWLKKPDDKAGPQAMRDAAAVLEAAQSHPGPRALWFVARAFFDALINGDLPNDPQVRQVCTGLERELRHQSAGAQTVPEQLMRDMLYWISQAPAQTDQQRAVWDTWGLAALIPEPGSTVTEIPLAPLLKTLHAELGSGKRAWDEFSAGQAAALPRLEAHLTQVVEHAGQLGRPALDRLLDGITRFVQWLRKDPLQFNDGIAIEMATALLLAEVSLDRGVPETGFVAQVNDTLDRLDALTRGEAIPAPEHSPTVEAARRSQEKDARAQVAREMLSNLAQVEQALDDFFRNQAKRAPLAGLTKPLKQIEGALALIGDEQAIELVHEAAETVARFADAEEHPDQGEFERLAQRLSALGFYIESLQHRPANLDRLLQPEGTRAEHDVEEVVAYAAEREIAALQETVILDMGDLAGTEVFAPESVEPVEMLDELSFDETARPDTGEEAPAETAESVAPPSEEVKPAHEEAAPLESSSATEDEGLDAELLEIFIEEAHEVLAAVDEQLGAMHGGSAGNDALTTIRRGFHTLKGSGRMVGLNDLGEAAWGIEQTLNRWLQLERPPSPALDALIGKAYTVFSAWVRQIENGEGHSRDVTELMAESASLREEESAPAHAPASVSAPPAQPEEVKAPAEEPAEREVETSLDLEEFAAEDEIEEREAPAWGNVESSDFLPEETALENVATEEPATTETEFDEFGMTLPELPEQTQAGEPPAAEAAAASPAMPVEPDLGEPEPSPAIDTGQAAPSAPVFDFGDLEEAPPEDETLELEAEPPALGDAAELPVTPEVSEVLEASVTPEVTEGFEVEAVPEAPEATEAPEPKEGPQAAEPDEAIAPEAAEPVALEISFEGLPEPIDLSIAESLEATTEAPAPVVEPALLRLGDVEISRPLFELYLAEARDHVYALHDEFAQLERNPTRVPSEPSLRAAHTLAGISGTARLPALHGLARALEHAIERLRERDEAPAAKETDLFQATTSTLEAMLAELATHQLPLGVPELEEQLQGVGLEVAEETTPVAAESENWEQAPGEPLQAEAAAVDVITAEPEPLPTVHDDLDEQLLPIFIEEGTELLGQLDSTLREWQNSPDETEHAKSTARLLHTLKGSARMAGAMTLGEHLHRMESRLEKLPSGGVVPASVLDEIVSGLDQASQMVGALARGERYPAAPADRREDKAIAAPVEIETAPVTAEAAGGLSTLRVRADMVDRFVNEAGEIGIARTRIEGELRTLRRSLLDLTENVIRLRNQLREVEIQAEVQMQSRIAQAESRHTEFDPLEMDRFTRLQELTRMMAESVGDVTTVQQNLLVNLDGAEVALNSQARLSRDLQQALMQVRMVPFDSLADRLHRIVRQTAKDLGKRANLDLRGGRIEIDRSVLERMTGPLEHLLRNAIAHGIEPRERRVAAGKEPIGQVTLTVAHEGNEIAITLQDDGEGLDFEGIAEKARSQGLLAQDENADERRLTNLIFVPGFSTAGSLSEIAGRGVGMDVVKADTASVGGRIDVRTTQGEGTEFRIHLPLTLAVTQALLVRAAGRTYAIPSTMIAQVLELKTDALERVIEEGGTSWQDRHFAYRYLPRLLGDNQTRPEVQRFNWLLLLHAGAQTLALHVDALRGNQEIVVKNAGPQLVRIIGIAGATVLGDGEIVLILNPVALASRSLSESDEDASAQGAEALPTDAPPARQPTVMIVDDSLTVRKITGRLLEREGYTVITAKDGADALEKLLETVPDVILSDIEMPRMDGFDLVRNIRADDRLKEVPVIMITSRMADKHRQYAEKIGANHYLGKPYEEDELLGLLKDYTAVTT
ncbi:MAG TPA: Hpt domain-containing protein [Rhodocyclaceae bacterium]|nr:Hpt domain-containing protein [Rhodocyclaceae bacterium]HRQ45895.1 Hpt domain-containing protein [Rhodocyclaceae bacterium]